ncbi:hypothetical protein EBX31_03590 [bacterium]|nr:hypothetical protein [bacterium]
MSAPWQPRVISFSCGGALILGHLGVLAALIDAGAIAGVREWWGCSGGSLCALVGALGVSAAWLRDCARHFDLRALGDLHGDPIVALQEKLGVANGDELVEIVGRFIDTWESGASAWTFADLATARPGVHLGITAVNVNRGELELFSAKTTPTVRLLDAVRASSAIPLFFTPWRGADGDLYCDGALLEEFPWSMIRNKAETLVVVCYKSQLIPVNCERTEVKNVSGYLTQLAQIGRRRLHLDGIDQERPKYWIAVNNQTVFELDIYLDADGRLALFNEGVVAAERWLAYRNWMAITSGSKKSEAAPSETVGTPPLCAGPHTAVPGHDGGSRMSGSHPLRTADGSYLSLHPDTGVRHRDRRWSL